MESVQPSEDEIFDAFLTQTYSIIHDVSPSVPIAQAYSAVYNQFQRQKWVIVNKPETIKKDKVDPDSKTKAMKKSLRPKDEPELEPFQLFTKYYFDKFKKQSVESINQKWNKMTETEKKKFYERHKDCA